ncbi:MAG: helix-turn-helix transcriptional regulator [Candidatus Saccharimonadaceae bacterium]
MPTGKNASYRYRLIDQALRNTGRPWTFEDLLNYLCDNLEEEFDVNLNGNKAKALSERQLAEDIHIMRKDPPQGYSAPIIRKGGLVYYEDPDFSINDNPLNDTDIEILNEVLRLIKSFPALPQLRELETIIGKVKGTISQSQGDQIIELEHNPNAKGLLHLEGLYPIIKNGREIHVTYKPFNWNEEIEYVIHPFLIKEYNNRWFLLGWKPDEKIFTVLGLDRIQKFNETGNPIVKSKQKELAQLCKNIIGVSFNEGAKPVEVKLWVSAAQLPYLITKPLHPSQKLIEEQQDGSILSFRLVPNFELEQTILMYGERVKVLAPIEMVSKIRERINEASGNYDTNN